MALSTTLLIVGLVLFAGIGLASCVLLLWAVSGIPIGGRKPGPRWVKVYSARIQHRAVAGWVVDEAVNAPAITQVTGLSSGCDRDRAWVTGYLRSSTLQWVRFAFALAFVQAGKELRVRGYLRPLMIAFNGIVLAVLGASATYGAWREPLFVLVILFLFLPPLFFYLSVRERVRLVSKWMLDVRR